MDYNLIQENHEDLNILEYLDKYYREDDDKNALFPK
jgi:hypothetical protein